MVFHQIGKLVLVSEILLHMYSSRIEYGYPSPSMVPSIMPSLQMVSISIAQNEVDSHIVLSIHSCLPCDSHRLLHVRDSIAPI